MNKLILGDCLEVLKTLDSETIDLIYIDPPFFSNRTYEVIWGDKGEIRSFEDRFSGGIEHYIAWLKERIQELHRILKPTGSIFVHCDWHANAYIKVAILDKTFGYSNLINEIVWCYTTPSNNKKRLPRKHDTVFWYGKSDGYTFNINDVKTPYVKLNTGKTNGIFKKAATLSEAGKTIEDWWADITPVGRLKNELIGYPTQKPEKLLERIIKMASNEGDVVLDCFVGGGTTIAVADKLHRHWIGIDQSVQAVKVTELRLQKQNATFETIYN
jgi:DNA modification methylase